MSAADGPPLVGGLAVVGLAGPELTPSEAALLRRFDVAGVILFWRNVVDRAQLTRLVAAVQQCRAAGAPSLLVCADQEGGSVAPLGAALGRPPSALALGLADDLQLTRRVHAETARRAAACGVRWLLAPVADVVAGENPVVATRAFGADPQRVAAHVAAAIQGLAEGGVATCAKHWPGHGRPTRDSHVAVPTLQATADELARTELPPFVAAVQARADAVMAAHVRVPQLDASGVVASRSPVLLGGWLRGRLGFEGVIASDALEMAGFHGAGPHDALAAGIDLLLFAAPVQEAARALGALQGAARRGAVDPARAEQARERIGRLRSRCDALARAAAPAAHPPAAADPSAYGEARARGVLWVRGSSAPEGRRLAPAAGTRWALLDAASRDRLLRAEPGPAPAPAAAPGPLPTARLEAALRERLGPPCAVVDLPSPADPSLDGQRLARGLDAVPAGVGLVLASLRPFPAQLGEVWRAQLRRLCPAWLAVLGDASLVRRSEGALQGAPAVLVPGVSVEDARVLAGLLSGDDLNR